MPRNDHERWQMDLEEYIRQGEPEQSEKSTAWETAIGLQDVDGLKTSEYLLETAKEHIEGRIDIKTAQKRIQSYYEERQTRNEIEEGTKEADSIKDNYGYLRERVEIRADVPFDEYRHPAYPDDIMVQFFTPDKRRELMWVRE